MSQTEAVLGDISTRKTGRHRDDGSVPSVSGVAMAGPQARFVITSGRLVSPTAAVTSVSQTLPIRIRPQLPPKSVESGSEHTSRSQ